jgi:two-component system chemotaxis response regulator CheY
MRVLLVDDVPGVRQFFRFVLRGRRDVQIDEAGDGLKALQLLRMHPYDLVLLDINLPLMDGIKVLRSFRSNEPAWKQTKFIIVSTSQDEVVLTQARELKAAAILPKPVPTSLLLSTIAEMFDLPKTSIVDDRRRSQRVQLPIEVVVEGEPPFTAETFDLSMTGAFIATDVLRAVGTRPLLTLTLPVLAAPLTVRAEVVHLRPARTGELPAGMGVRFIDLGPDDERRLAAAFASPTE